MCQIALNTIEINLVTATRTLQLLDLSSTLLLVSAQSTTVLASVLVHPSYCAQQSLHKLRSIIQSNRVR